MVFGDNSRGQLGLDNYAHQNKPIVLMHDKQIREIVCGTNHTIILKENNDVLVFLSSGADITAENNAALVEYLIRQGADVITNCNDLIIMASKYGHLEFVEYLSKWVRIL